MARIAWLLSLCVVVACGDVLPSGSGDGGPDVHDAAAGASDAAAPDAQPQPPPTPSREFAGAAGQVSGATYTLDVEFGLPFSSQPASSATYTIEANAAVKP